ncbi:flotillin [Nocardioides alpinus]|uniref:Flotillin n=1 Tax=Nocardioides alpinus TaxID=748909 RepID=A0A1I0W0Q4_9ACTN|nr:flotillin domain-containing protein [Nocardioides alpinus]SFA81790.1 flotillin [Nocardioides alpinus]
MDKKAAAFAGYNEAAVLQMLIEVMPKVAAELARPMGNIDKLTVISADGAGELPKQVTNNFVQTMELLKTTTGLDVESLIQKYAGTTSGVAPTAAPAGLAGGTAGAATD